jgi:mono/diheme cytochrome c family protein
MAAEESKDPKVTEGKLVFKNNCQRCHPNGEAGVGPPLNNIHLPGFLLRARIRSRAFLLWTGRMPSFKRQEISKKEMNVLVAYLKDLRKRK